PDTSGISVMSVGSIPKYLADETGVQHYAVGGLPAECFVKSAGSPWSPDTAGWGILPANYPNIVASDAHGFLYAAVTTTTDYTGLLLRRPIAGGSWVLDTAGLQKAVVYSLSADQAGNLYAGTYGGGIYKKTGGTWAPLSIPGGLSGNNAFVTAVDKSGALFAGFSYLNGYNYLWQGVYYTTNDGGTWTKVGLDSVAVRALIPYGDSIYAVTYYDGLYVLTRSGATGVAAQRTQQPSMYALFQNYPNPFNPTTTIRFSIGKLSMVNLKIYDLLGREVETLVNGAQTPGSHEVKFDASRLSSGIYFYQLQAGSFSATKKLLLLK
ncbi:MAG TPA: T9SS type A sorting domain-containing protein, partial [Bacteroidota bacterium]